jgi:polar amino acid transport system substrate-binding protein
VILRNDFPKKKIKAWLFHLNVQGRRMKLRSLCFVLVVSIGLGVGPSSGQAAVRALAVVTPPFVVEQGDHLTGFSIDLWNEIADRLKLETEYKVLPGVQGYYPAMKSKSADMVVSGVFYTKERDMEFDFAYPILESGLQVMVLESGTGLPLNPFRNVADLLFSKAAMVWLIVALVIAVVPAHLIWMFDRGNADGASPKKNYFPGIFDSFTWSVTALVNQVMCLPQHWLARVIGLLWLFAGVVFVALYTAELTATLTVQHLRSAIQGPGDLPGRRVGTIAQSTGETYLRGIQAEVVSCDNTKEMLQALMDKKVDALLFSSATLRYLSLNEGKGRVMMVGPEFNRQNIGYVFQLGDPLRKKVGNTLLALREDGTYDRIYEKWFGKED